MRHIGSRISHTSTSCFLHRSRRLTCLSRWCGFVYKAQKDKHSKTGCVCGCPYATVGIEVATQDEKIRAKMDER